MKFLTRLREYIGELTITTLIFALDCILPDELPEELSNAPDRYEPCAGDITGKAKVYGAPPETPAPEDGDFDADPNWVFMGETLLRDHKMLPVDTELSDAVNAIFDKEDE